MKARVNARLQRHHHRRARRRANRQAVQRRLTGTSQNRGRAMILPLFQSIQHFFPELFEQLRQLQDCQRKSDYPLAEILMAGIALFMF